MTRTTDTKSPRLCFPFQSGARDAEPNEKQRNEIARYWRERMDARLGFTWWTR
jgi:hypothetical protein